MPRTFYLQRIARRTNHDIPLLKPPRTVARRGETISSLSQDALAEIGPFVQRPPALTGEATSVPFLQAAADMKEHNPTLSETRVLSETLEKTAEGVVAQEITRLSPNPPLKRYDLAIPKAPVLPSPGDSAEVERSTPRIVSERPDMEVQLTLAETASRATVEKHEPLPAAQVASAVQIESATEAQVIRSRQRSTSEQELAAVARSARSWPIDDSAPQKSDRNMQSSTQPAHITLVPLPPARPAPLMRESEMSRGTAIRIGAIDVQIVPSPVASPLPPAGRSITKPQSAPALSREFTSFFGLRQG